MHTEIANKKDELVELCLNFEVSRLDIFGSGAQGVDFDPNTSDVDFLVEFHSSSKLGPFEQFFGFADALRQTLNRPVDLVESNAIINPYLRTSIDRSCELIYKS